jgi:hypothetical protein
MGRFYAYDWRIVVRMGTKRVLMKWVGAIHRTVSYSYHDSGSSGLTASVSNSRLADGVGYYNNHVLH